MQLVAFSRMRGLLMKWLKPCFTFLRRRNSSLHRAANPFLKGSISFCHNGEQHITETQYTWMKQKWLLISEMQITQRWQCIKNFICRISTLYRTGREGFAHGQSYWNDIFKNFFSPGKVTVYMHWYEPKQPNRFLKRLHLQYCTYSGSLLVKQAKSQCLTFFFYVYS